MMIIPFALSFLLDDASRMPMPLLQGHFNITYGDHFHYAVAAFDITPPQQASCHFSQSGVIICLHACQVITPRDAMTA